MNWEEINCVVIDFGDTLCSGRYFQNGPASIPGWYDIFQSKIFGSGKGIFEKWMSGEINAIDISQYMESTIGLDSNEILFWMKDGCKRLTLNQSVLELVYKAKASNKKTALVTGNIDLFTSIVVPDLSLNLNFDTIINSFEYNETDKSKLWPIAFQDLDISSSYSKALLVEDSEANVNMFKQNGGLAYRYQGETQMSHWISQNIPH